MRARSDDAAVAQAVERRRDRAQARDGVLERERVGDVLGEQPRRVVDAAVRGEVRAGVAAAREA